MTAKLFTATHGFVGEVEMPPFSPLLLPGILVWGERFFILTSDSEPHYTETMAYWIPPGYATKAVVDERGSLVNTTP